MQMKLLPHNIKKMRTLQVEHLLAAREALYALRLDAQDRVPVGELDEEVVASYVEDLLLHKEGFGLLGEKLGEDADGGGGGHRGRGRGILFWAVVEGWRVVARMLVSSGKGRRVGVIGRR